jgi:integrase/recombinase XerD
MSDVEDMRMRKLAPKTKSAYLFHVGRFAPFLGRLPDAASSEDLRLFQLHLVEQAV